MCIRDRYWEVEEAFLRIFVQPERKIIMKKIISIVCVLAMSIGLSACNTFKGVGQDVQRGGEKIQDAASGK